MRPRTGARRRGVVRAFAAVVAAAALLALPGAALAQDISPTNDQYDPTSEQIASGVGGGSGSGTAGGDPPGDSSTSSGRVVSGLPFTGADLGLLGAVAALLGAGGIALRKLGGSRAGS